MGDERDERSSTALKTWRFASNSSTTHSTTRSTAKFTASRSVVASIRWRIAPVSAYYQHIQDLPEVAEGSVQRGTASTHQSDLRPCPSECQRHPASHGASPNNHHRSGWVSEGWAGYFQNPTSSRYARSTERAWRMCCRISSRAVCASPAARAARIRPCSATLRACISSDDRTARQT